MLVQSTVAIKEVETRGSFNRHFVLIIRRPARWGRNVKQNDLPGSGMGEEERKRGRLSSTRGILMELCLMLSNTVTNAAAECDKAAGCQKLLDTFAGYFPRQATNRVQLLKATVYCVLVSSSIHNCSRLGIPIKLSLSSLFRHFFKFVTICFCHTLRRLKDCPHISDHLKLFS